MKYSSCLFIAILSCLSASAADYEIRLHRPLQAGDKYELTANARFADDSTMTRDGKLERTNQIRITVDLEGDVTVLEVKNGKPVKQSIQVSRLSRTENEQMKILAGSGSTIIASIENGKKVFTLNGGLPSPTERQALSLVTDLEAVNHTDDELFGTSERKKVGDSWPANATLLAESLNEGSPFRVENVSGKATLKEVAKSPAGPVLVVTVEATGKAGSELSPGLKVEESELRFMATGRFPVDLKQGRPEDTEEVNFSFHAKGKTGDDPREVEVKGNANRTVTFKRKPIQ